MLYIFCVMPPFIDDYFDWMLSGIRSNNTDQTVKPCLVTDQTKFVYYFLTPFQP